MKKENSWLYDIAFKYWAYGIMHHLLCEKAWMCFCVERLEWMLGFKVMWIVKRVVWEVMRKIDAPPSPLLDSKESNYVKKRK
jgi:hypothetical protein